MTAETVMSPSQNSIHEAGTIVSVFTGRDADRGFLTAHVSIDFEASHQAFGCVVFDTDEHLADFVEDLLCIFGVREVPELVGKPVIALRCFGGWNEPIEGLEAESGRRFILTEWRRKFWPDSKSPLEARRMSTKATIASLERRIREEQVKLDALDAEYVEWISTKEVGK